MNESVLVARILEANRKQPPFNPYLLGCALVAALGGLLFGFDTAVISGTTDALRTTFALSDNLLGFTVASALIGTILGSVGASRPADIIGRRGALVLLGVLYFTSALGCSFAWDWWSFLFFRLLGGMAVGGASVVSPLYIAEISPSHYRGRLVAITQFNIVLGILLAYLSNYLIGMLHLGEHEWRWMFGVMAAPSAVFCLLIFLIPQSPRWLVARGRLTEARAVLQRCGTDSGSVEDDIREIEHSMDLAHHWRSPSLSAATVPPSCSRWPLARSINSPASMRCSTTRRPSSRWREPVPNQRCCNR